MKNYFFFILLLNVIDGTCGIKGRAEVKPQALDTVKVYNVYCSYTDSVSFTAWSGFYTSFFAAEECPKRTVQKYVANYKLLEPYLLNPRFFWMKLYNTKDELIYEGLKHGDCRIGSFICYWPTGKKRMTGQFDGVVIKKQTGEYFLKKCAGEKTGTWCYYNEEGRYERIEKY